MRVAAPDVQMRAGLAVDLARKPACGERLASDCAISGRPGFSKL